MTAFPKKPSFRDWQAAAGNLGKGEKLSTLKSGFVAVYGSSEFLVGHSVALLRKHATELSGMAVTPLEASTLTAESLNAILSQGSLFDPKTLYIVRRAEQAKGLGALLKAARTVPDGANLVVLAFSGEPLAAVKTELLEREAHLVPCADPYPSEVPVLLRKLAEAHRLRLAPAAYELLLETTGPDLAKLDQELLKLGLVFSEHQGELGAQDLAPHLGVLREDEAFALDRLLLARQGAKAQALLTNLLARGEKGLALLGILAGHCRHSLRLIELNNRGVSPADMASAMRLPPFIVKSYAQGLRGAEPARYLDALGRCQEVDTWLKRSQIREDLGLAYVLEALAADG